MIVIDFLLAVLVLIVCVLALALPCVAVVLKVQDGRRFDQAARYWLPITRRRRLWNKRARCLRLADMQRQKASSCWAAAKKMWDDGDEGMRVIFDAEGDEARRLEEMYERDAEGWSKAIRLHEARKLVG